MLRFLNLCILTFPLLCGCSDPVLLGFRVSSGLPLPDSAFFLTAHRDSLASKHVSQAELLARTGRLEDAALAYEHALSYSMNVDAEASLYLALGSVYGAQGVVGEAERAYRAAVDSPRFAHLAHWALGSLFSREGRFIDAERELELSLALRAGWFPALHDLGSVMMIQGDVEAGIANFQGALRSLEEGGADLAGEWESRQASNGAHSLQASELEAHLIAHILQVFRLPGKGRQWRGGVRGGAPTTTTTTTTTSGSGSGSGSGSTHQQEVEEDAVVFQSQGASLWGFLHRLQTLDLADFHRGMGLKLLESGAFDQGHQHLQRAISLAPSVQGHLIMHTTLSMPLVYSGREEVWRVRSRLVRDVREALEDRSAVIHPEHLRDLYMLQFQLPYSGLPAHLLMRDVAGWLASCEDPVLVALGPHLHHLYPHAIAASVGVGWGSGGGGGATSAALRSAAAAAAAAAATGNGGGAGPGSAAPRRKKLASTAVEVGVGGESGGSRSEDGGGDDAAEEVPSLPPHSPFPGNESSAADAAHAATPLSPPTLWDPFIAPATTATPATPTPLSRPPSSPPPPPTVRIGIVTYQALDTGTGHLLHRLVRHLKGYKPALLQHPSPPLGAFSASSREGPSPGGGALPRFLEGGQGGEEGAGAVWPPSSTWDAPFVHPWGEGEMEGGMNPREEGAAGSSTSTNTTSPPLDPLLTHFGYPRLLRTPVAGFNVTLFRMTRYGDDLTKWLIGACDRVVDVTGMMVEANKSPRFDLTVARRGIEREGLDVLIVADPGVTPTLYTLLFSRMAPIQVALWGGESASALTLGLPNTVDYYVVGDASSPPTLQAELVEQGVRLGGLGYFFPKLRDLSPREVGDAVARHGILSTSTLYFVPADINSLHPAFDSVIMGILHADPHATVMLLCETGQDLWVAKLRRRLSGHSLASAGPRGEGVGSSNSSSSGSSSAPTPRRLLSRLTFHEELGGVVGNPSSSTIRALMAAADVVLDTFPVGLGIKVLEALGMGTPVVTLPSMQPQRTLTLGALEALGSDLVGHLCQGSVEGMVGKAIELATNKTLKGEVHASLLTRFPSLVWKDKHVEEYRSKGGGGAAKKKKGQAAAPQHQHQNSPPTPLSDWERKRATLGYGGADKGALNDWLTFLARAGRPWALDREATLAMEANHTSAVAGEGKGGGGSKGSPKAARARQRKRAAAAMGSGKP